MINPECDIRLKDTMRKEKEKSFGPRPFFLFTYCIHSVLYP